jgi:hypothetical protein
VAGEVVSVLAGASTSMASAVGAAAIRSAGVGRDDGLGDELMKWVDRNSEVCRIRLWDIWAAGPLFPRQVTSYNISRPTRLL